ncbi:MAG: glycosyltransferase, partial [Clostridium celatum]|nr:glycosyltransferase [Clostridium celatum]
SRDIVESYIKRYKYIKYFKHKKNMGANAARNKGVQLAKGEYISFLDSDDEWLPRKLEKEIQYFRNDNELVMVYSNMFLVNENKGKTELFIQDNYKDKLYGLLCKNIIGSTSLITIRKNEFTQLKGFKEGLPSCQDWNFYIRVAEKYKIQRIDEALLKYYIHSDSISGNLENVVNGHKLIIKQVEDIIEKNSLYTKEKDVIIANQYINLAQIYKSFGKFNESKEYYKRAIKKDKFNKKAIKNLMFMIFGKKIYLFLKELNLK